MKILEKVLKYWDTISIFKNFDIELEKDIQAKAWKMTGDTMRYTINDVIERLELDKINRL